MKETDYNAGYRAAMIFAAEQMNRKDERIEALERERDEFSRRLQNCLDMLHEKGVSTGEVWDRLATTEETEQ